MDLKETTDKVIKYKLKYSAQELEDKLDKVDQEYSLEEKEKLNGLKNYDDSQIKSDVNTLTENKLDKNQGIENSGKVLGTNANGEVIPLNGYGFEYDEETKMLKYGTDPTSNLNQGIGLDDTLSKTGYAADAGAVGELKEDLIRISEKFNKNVLPIEAKENTVLKCSTSYEDGVVRVVGTSSGNGGRLTGIVPRFHLEKGHYVFSKDKVYNDASVSNDLALILQNSNGDVMAILNASALSVECDIVDDAVEYFIGATFVSGMKYDVEYMIQLELDEKTDIRKPSYSTAKDIKARADIEKMSSSMGSASINLKFETDVTGKYISVFGEITTLESASISKPFKILQGETITIVTRSYKLISTLAKISGNSYTSLISGNDDYTTFQTFKFVAPEDMIVCISTYTSAIPNTIITISNDKTRYDDVYENPLSSIRYDGGLTSIFKNIGCIGDSLASGEVVGTDADGKYHSEDKYEFSWGQRIAKMTGNTAFNFSHGGLTTKSWLGRYGNGGTNASDFENHKCEAYIVALGQNDSYPDERQVPVGTSSDIGTDVNSYYANYYKIIQRIKSVQPKAKIFVITNPYPRNTPDTGWTYDGYDDAVRYMAEHYENVFLIDFQKYAKNFHTDRRLWFSGHMTAVGYQQSAWLISTYIDWIIRTNMDKFRDVQWIGTDYTVPNA